MSSSRNSNVQTRQQINQRTPVDPEEYGYFNESRFANPLITVQTQVHHPERQQHEEVRQEGNRRPPTHHQAHQDRREDHPHAHQFHREDRRQEHRESAQVSFQPPLYEGELVETRRWTCNYCMSPSGMQPTYKLSLSAFLSHIMDEHIEGNDYEYIARVLLGMYPPYVCQPASRQASARNSVAGGSVRGAGGSVRGAGSAPVRGGSVAGSTASNGSRGRTARNSRAGMSLGSLCISEPSQAVFDDNVSDMD